MAKLDRRRINFTCWLVGILLIAGSGGCGKKSATPTIEGKIVFESNRWPYTGEAYSGHGVCLLENGKIKPLFKGFLGSRFSKDGRWISCVDSTNKDSDITLIDVATRKYKQKILPRYSAQDSWFPDNERIAYVGDTGQAPRNTTPNLFLYHLTTGEELQLTHYDQPNSYIGSIDVSPDGKKIVFARSEKFGDGNSHIYLLHLPELILTELTSGSDARWSPDGKRVVHVDFVEVKGETSSISRSIMQVMIYDLETQQIHQVTGLNGDLGGAIKSEPCFSPDGKEILFIDWVPNGKRLQVIQVDGTHEWTVIPAGHDLMHIDWAR